jgi:hypothetical protein
MSLAKGPPNPAPGPRFHGLRSDAPAGASAPNPDKMAVCPYVSRPKDLNPLEPSHARQEAAFALAG